MVIVQSHSHRSNIFWIWFDSSILSGRAFEHLCRFCCLRTDSWSPFYLLSVWAQSSNEQLGQRNGSVPSHLQKVEKRLGMPHPMSVSYRMSRLLCSDDFREFLRSDAGAVSLDLLQWHSASTLAKIGHFFLSTRPVSNGGVGPLAPRVAPMRRAKVKGIEVVLACSCCSMLVMYCTAAVYRGYFHSLQLFHVPLPCPLHPFFISHWRHKIHQKLELQGMTLGNEIVCYGKLLLNRLEAIGYDR